MNPTDSYQKVEAKSKSGVAQGGHQPAAAEPDVVDEYMRHVGRTLYEIIRDWLKEQQALKASAEPAPKLNDRVAEGGISR